MEKVKELLKKAFEAGQDYEYGRHFAMNKYPDFDTWLSNNSAQSEALSVGNNEQAKECCPRCGSTATQPMGKAMMCNNGRV